MLRTMPIANDVFLHDEYCARFQLFFPTFVRLSGHPAQAFYARARGVGFLSSIMGQGAGEGVCVNRSAWFSTHELR